MADIKTREKAAGTIKTLDRAKAGTRRIKNATVYSKETAEKSVDIPENSPEEYATDKVSQKTKSAADTAVRQFDKQGRKSIDRTRHNVQKAKDNFGKSILCSCTNIPRSFSTSCGSASVSTELLLSVLRKT